MKKTLLIILALLILSGGVGAYFVFSGSEDEGSVLPTVRVRRGELIEQASASGTVEPDVQVEVKSRTSGEVIAVVVEEGAEVEAGQLLVRLDPIDAERDLEQAQVALSRARAELAQVRAQLQVARAEAEEAEETARVRARGAKMGLIASEEQRTSATSARVAGANVVLREAQVQSARAAVRDAELTVAEAERRLDETTIEAPVSGTVLAVEVEQGAIVASGITNVGGGTTLLTIADLSDLRVVGDLSEAQVGNVSEGQEVVIRVDAYPRRTFDGRVARVSPLGEEESNVVTFDVEVVITDEDAHMLRSGMSADVEIVTSHSENALLIPVVALRSRGQDRFVLNEAGERRPIRTGATDGTNVVVLEGLEEGESIISASRGGERQGGGERRRRGLFPGPGGPPPPRR